MSPSLFFSLLPFLFLTRLDEDTVEDTRSASRCHRWSPRHDIVHERSRALHGVLLRPSPDAGELLREYDDGGDNDDGDLAR